MTRRATLQGTRIRLDATPYTTVYTCDVCGRNFGPFTSSDDAAREAMDHWDQWHRRHKVGTDCTMPGCDAPHVALGYCRRHYMRVRRTGDPTVRERKRR